jgi:hypothetical protein
MGGWILKAYLRYYCCKFQKRKKSLRFLVQLRRNHFLYSNKTDDCFEHDLLYCSVSMLSLPGIAELVEIASIAHNGQHVCVLAFLSLTTAQPFLAVELDRKLPTTGTMAASSSCSSL